ncbi:hypothetical protein KVT40_000012 [Elsinoe batatas]|uniref:Uncharacterized protein n=1 Tax=Elsinoe batatas TaxID=2601811 RepID=A0A8K0PJU7_9PEZI|nr:hypothetical protein KVT40_000012 [Elsinoe batatas]
MSQPTSSPPSQPPSAPAPDPKVTYQRAIHTLALSLTLICPAIIALPPRRLDLMTAILGGTTCVSLNHLHSERYGYGVLGRVVPSYRHRNPRAFSAPTDPSSPSSLSSIASLPTQPQGQLQGSGRDALPTDRARELQAQFSAARAVQHDSLTRAEQEEKAVRERTLGEKVWYGEESKEGWAEKRDREIREKFEEGKGIGDVIWEQVWEVWNWGGMGEGGEGGQGGGKGK